MNLLLQQTRALIVLSTMACVVGVTHAQQTGAVREGFIQKTKSSCFKTQRVDPRNSSFADQKLWEYCSCYATYIANATTNQLLAEVESGVRPISAITSSIPFAGKYCAKQVLQ